MEFCVLTLFPDVIHGYMSASIPGRALEKQLFHLRCMNIRDFTRDKHRRVDDAPFGGGAGMIMTPQPLFDCIAAARAQMPAGSPVVYLSPAGQVLNNRISRSFAQLPGLILLCGHYEGIDQRVIDSCVDMELSIGNYVLTGGELASLVVMDSVIRFISGVVGNADVHEQESFENGLLEYPQYTRPQEFQGLRVPDVLLTGHHVNIEAWKQEQALEKTRRMRPDLLDTPPQTDLH